MNEFTDRVKDYLGYCRKAAAELRLAGFELSPKLHPTEGGCLKLVFHRGDAAEKLIREAYRELCPPRTRGGGR